jgi:protein required for attachment to host cells
MSTTWILVANRSGARLFENSGPGKGLILLHDIAHVEGHLKNQDFNADKPGRSFDSVGEGRHSAEKSQSPTEHETKKFGKELADILNEGRTTNAYESLVLVAEAGFLGVLKGELDNHVSKLVSQTVEKDLAKVADGDIAASLSPSIKI